MHICIISELLQLGARGGCVVLHRMNRGKPTLPAITSISPALFENKQALPNVISEQLELRGRGLCVILGRSRAKPIMDPDVTLTPIYLYSIVTVLNQGYLALSTTSNQRNFPIQFEHKQANKQTNEQALLNVMSEQLVLGGHGRDAEGRQSLGDGLRGAWAVHVSGESCPGRRIYRFGRTADEDSAEHGLRSYGE